MSEVGQDIFTANNGIQIFQRQCVEPGCQKTFTPMHMKQIYCSTEHRAASGYDRRLFAIRLLKFMEEKMPDSLAKIRHMMRDDI